MSEQIGVPAPQVTLFVTHVELREAKVPGGEQGEQPGIAMVLNSGDLRVNALFPANDIHEIAGMLIEAQKKALAPINGIVLPGKVTPEQLREMVEGADKLRGDKDAP